MEPAVTGRNTRSDDRPQGPRLNRCDIIQVRILVLFYANRADKSLFDLLHTTVLAVIVALIDAPLDLLAYLWTLFVDAFDRDWIHWILKYHEFMSGGGRLALAGADLRILSKEYLSILPFLHGGS